MLTGKKLKIARIKKNLKAQYIAEKIGVSKSYISKLEREIQDIPKHIYIKWIKVLKGDVK